MKSVRYVGWRGDLKGKTALAREGGWGRKGEARVLIQLDQQYLDDPVADGEERRLNPLAFGWHDFAADQWEEIPREERV